MHFLVGFRGGIPIHLGSLDQGYRYAGILEQLVLYELNYLLPVWGGELMKCRKKGDGPNGG